MSRTQTTDGTGTPDLEDLAAQIAALKSDITGLTEMILDMGQARTRQATRQAHDKIEETLSAARTAGSEALSDTLTGARTKAVQASDEIGDFIHRQPATALGIAAGLGFLIGLYGGRR
jgi:ElaB/YqjD/DUF883 family membrane-anchored ribosome-binding protein